MGTSSRSSICAMKSSPESKLPRASSPAEDDPSIQCGYTILAASARPDSGGIGGPLDNVPQTDLVAVDEPRHVDPIRVRFPFFGLVRSCLLLFHDACLRFTMR